MSSSFRDFFSSRSVRFSGFSALGLLSISTVHYIGFTDDFPSEWPLRLIFDLGPSISSELIFSLVISAGFAKLAAETLKHITPTIVSPLLLFRKTRRWVDIVGSTSSRKSYAPGLYIGAFWASFSEIYLDGFIAYYTLLFAAALLVPFLTYPYFYTMRYSIARARIRRELRQFKRGVFRGFLMPTAIFSLLALSYALGSERFYALMSLPAVEIKTAEGTERGYIVSEFANGIVFASDYQTDRNGYPAIIVFRGEYSVSSADVD